MKPGFLRKPGSGTAASPSSAAPQVQEQHQQQQHAQRPPAAARVPAPPQKQPGQDAPPPAATATTTPNAASWQQCMQLLKSDSEEKKFVGLLLVTKLLPQGTESALQSVLDAVGWPFLQRMLLPLRTAAANKTNTSSGSSSGSGGGQQQPVDADKLQQQQLSVSLGISIISALARLQQVAASEELLQLTPLLSRVAAAGGVAPALVPQQQQQGSGVAAAAAGAGGGVLSWADRAADAAAAVDALECLLACASSGSYQRTVVLESSGLHTATAALACALTAAAQATKSGSSQQHAGGLEGQEAAVALAAAAARAVMLCVQLLGVLVSSSAPDRATLLQQHQTEAAAAVMLLAAVFGGQHLGLVTTTTTSSSSSSGKQSQQQQQQHVDAAALQLEALHTLLLLLPLPEAAAQAHTALSAAAAADSPNPSITTAAGTPSSSSSNSLLLSQSAAAAAGDWPSALRRGLVTILRGKVGAVQRHSALQLAAAALELLGPAWLLPPQSQSQQQQQQVTPGSNGVTSSSSSSKSSSSSSGKASSAGVRPDEFLLVLMEVLAIETPLLLSDAMNPGAAVPRSDLAAAAAAAATAAKTAAAAGVGSGSDADSGSEGGSDDVDMADAAADAGHQLPQPLSVRQVVQQQQLSADKVPGSGVDQQQQQPGSSGWRGPPGFEQQQPGQQPQGQQGQQHQPMKPLRQQLAELQLPDDKPVGEGQQQAGARALQVLPSCYQLLEGCLEVLVHQVTLLEDLADVTLPAASSHQPPHQPPAAADAAAGGGVNGGVDVGGDNVVGGRPVSWVEVLPVLGPGQIEQLMGRMEQVTQVVVEFLAYATSPSAAAAEAAAPVNSWLTLGAVRLLGRFLSDAPGAHEGAVQQLLPHLLKQQGPAVAAAGGGGGNTTQQRADGVDGELVAPVVSFLLPAMLMWTCKHHSSYQQWVELMLAPESGCLTALAHYITAMAAAAAATALGVGRGSSSSAGSGDGSGSGVDEGSEAQLGRACQVLFQLLSSRAVVLSARSGSSSGGAKRKQTASVPPTPPAFDSAQAAALADALQNLCSWSATRHKQLVPLLKQQQQVQSASQLSQPLLAAAQGVLTGVQGIGLALPTLLPAAALVGQLLGLAEVNSSPTAAAAVAAAAELLNWGCHVGWCVQLLVAASAADAAAQSDCGSAPVLLLEQQQQQLELWEVAELEEVWDACLLSAAELLTQHGAGSVFGRVLAARDGWLSQAAAADAAAAAAAVVVVEDSPSLQLLLQALAVAR